MKKIYIFSFLTLITISLKSQNLKKESKEISNLLHYFALKDSCINQMFYYQHDTLILNQNFSSYKFFNIFLISNEDSSNDFAKYSPLKLAEKMRLKSLLSIDDSTIKVKSYNLSKIKILKKTEFQQNNQFVNDIAKPIFFRNYTLCLIIIYNRQSLNSFFLKKVHNRWHFYKYFAGYIE